MERKKIALVVGAASGIGKATAARFRSSETTVVGIDQASIDQSDGLAGSFQIDATDFKSLQSAAEEICEAFGVPDHIVVSIGKCSGVFGFPFWNQPPELWADSLNVNLVAPVNVAQVFLPLMLPRRSGSICFVASVAGQIGSQTDPPYSAAKAGLINFMQCAAKDLAPYGIRSNAVSPGMVKTPMNRQVWEAWRGASEENTLSYEDWAEQKIQQIAPLARWQTNDDVAEAIYFLASQAAKNITGQTLNVDGGQVMHA